MLSTYGRAHWHYVHMQFNLCALNFFFGTCEKYVGYVCIVRKVTFLLNT